MGWGAKGGVGSARWERKGGWKGGRNAAEWDGNAVGGAGCDGAECIARRALHAAREVGASNAAFANGRGGSGMAHGESGAREKAVGWETDRKALRAAVSSSDRDEHGAQWVGGRVGACLKQVDYGVPHLLVYPVAARGGSVGPAASRLALTIAV